MLSQLFVPSKAADSMIMGYYPHGTIGYSKMQTYMSLRFRWRSFLGHSRIFVATIFA